MTSVSPPLPLLASLLFTLMGPIALMPTFAAATAGVESRLRLRIALVALLTALITLGLAVLVGAVAMAKSGTQPSSLIIAAGLILTLTALRNLLGPATRVEPAQRTTVTAARAVSPASLRLPASMNSFDQP